MIQFQVIVIESISHLARPYYNSKGIIQSIGKCFDSQHDKYGDDPYALMVSFDDISTALISPQSSQLISTIFPPPTSTSVQQICFSTKIQRVLLLLKTNSLCVYKTDKSTAVLEKMIYFNQFRVNKKTDLLQVTYLGQKGNAQHNKLVV